MNMHIFKPREIKFAAYRFQVYGLATGHASRSTRMGQGIDHFEPLARRRRDLRIMGQDPKSQGLQRITGEDSRGLVKSSMTGRTASAEIIVIHRGQIIMD